MRDLMLLHVLDSAAHHIDRIADLEQQAFAGSDELLVTLSLILRGETPVLASNEGLLHVPLQFLQYDVHPLTVHVSI